MPILTNPRHERFAQELASGKTATEAYASVYEVEGATAAVNGSKLLKNAKILARLAEFQSRATEGVVLTKQWVIEKLIENANRAMQAQAVVDNDGRPTGEYKYEGSVANRALELLGKEQGMFVDRKEIGKPGEFERMNVDEVREYIRREAAELGIGGPALEGLNGSGKPH